jgi:hypothetical protein
MTRIHKRKVCLTSERFSETICRDVAILSTAFAVFLRGQMAQIAPEDNSSLGASLDVKRRFTLTQK